MTTLADDTKPIKSICSLCRFWVEYKDENTEHSFFVCRLGKEPEIRDGKEYCMWRQRRQLQSS